MKKHLTIVLVTVLALILFAGTLILLTHNKLPYDNTTDKYDLITTTYSKGEIEKLKSTFDERRPIGGWEYTYAEFREDFKAECIRKNNTGYYVILLQDDGSEVFVLFGEDLNMYRVFIFDRFLSKDEFSNLTTIEEVILLDPNTILGISSAVSRTSHIVKEGWIDIVYDRKGHAIETITFTSNDELNGKGYILEIDKYI